MPGHVESIVIAGRGESEIEVMRARRASIDGAARELARALHSGTREIHGHIEGHQPSGRPASTSFARIIIQMVGAADKFTQSAKA